LSCARIGRTPFFQPTGVKALAPKVSRERALSEDEIRILWRKFDDAFIAVLNHAKQGVIKVYNQHRYDTEKQKALEAWERKLNSIISSGWGGFQTRPYGAPVPATKGKKKPAALNQDDSFK
jgi:hypothetical protein